MKKHIDLFSGIGGFALAVDRVWPGAEHLFCDNDKFCQAILHKHWPGAKIHDDIRNFKNEKDGEAFILTGGGSRASLSLKPDSAKERRTTATSGLKCLGSSENFARHGSSLRTCVALLLGTTEWYSNKCALTWKLKVTKSNRSLFQLSPSTRHIDETASGLLPTVRAKEGNAGSAGSIHNYKKRYLDGTIQEGLIPTPTTQEVEHSQMKLSKTGRRIAKNGNTHSVGLTDKIVMLKTPGASEAVGGAKTDDKYWNAKAPKLKTRDQIARTGIESGERLRLQPAMPEWMMGYPSHWADLNYQEPETETLKSKRTATR